MNSGAADIQAPCFDTIKISGIMLQHWTTESTPWCATCSLMHAGPCLVSSPCSEEIVGGPSTESRREVDTTGHLSLVPRLRSRHGETLYAGQEPLEVLFTKTHTHDLRYLWPVNSLVRLLDLSKFDAGDSDCFFFFPHRPGRQSTYLGIVGVFSEMQHDLHLCSTVEPFWPSTL